MYFLLNLPFLSATSSPSHTACLSCRSCTRKSIANLPATGTSTSDLADTSHRRLVFLALPACHLRTPATAGSINFSDAERMTTAMSEHRHQQTFLVVCTERATHFGKINIEHLFGKLKEAHQWMSEGGWELTSVLPITQGHYDENFGFSNTQAIVLFCRRQVPEDRL